ncbi:MAG: hypothetical protein OCD01_09815 [Fibrobacterales bacterium]
MKNEQLPTESPIELTTESLATDPSSTESISPAQSIVASNVEDASEIDEDNTIKPAMKYLFEEWFNELKAEITRVPEDEMLDLRMPPDRFLKESDAMISNIKHFSKELTASGYDATIVETLEKRTGASRMAQTRMELSKRELEDSQKRWVTITPVVFELRDSMYHDFKFACRKNKAVLDILKDLGKGRSIADMIQDLHTLGHLGDSIIKELEAINYDFSKLETAKAYTMELGQLQQEVSLKGSINKTDRTMRDKAFTLVDVIVMDTRERARWIFRDDKQILNKFLSPYNRSKYSRTRRLNEEARAEESIDSASDESSSEAV